SLGADSATGGDRFAATVAQPVTDELGQAVIPIGAKVFGHVESIQTGAGEQPTAIALAIDSVSIDGYERPLRARIVGTDVDAARHGINPAYIAANAGEGQLGDVI